MDVKVEIKTVRIADIKLNQENPRTITEKSMKRLVKSLSEFPEMLNIREIVVDENMTILGGNMRLLALRKAGAKDCMAKTVTGLTDEQKREFIIKDNAAFGQWDFDELANAWDDLPLAEWGVDLPDHWQSEPRDGGAGGDGNGDSNLNYQVIIECESEQHQIGLIQRFEKEGFKCHPLIL